MHGIASHCVKSNEIKWNVFIQMRCSNWSTNEMHDQIMNFCWNVPVNWPFVNRVIKCHIVRCIFFWNELWRFQHRNILRHLMSQSNHNVYIQLNLPILQYRSLCRCNRSILFHLFTTVIHLVHVCVCVPPHTAHENHNNIHKKKAIIIFKERRTKIWYYDDQHKS